MADKAVLNRELGLRILSAVFLIPLCLYIILHGKEIFYASIALIVLLMGIEWNGILKKLNYRNDFEWSMLYPDRGNKKSHPKEGWPECSNGSLCSEKGGGQRSQGVWDRSIGGFF